jgi:hypothetical protein
MAKVSNPAIAEEGCATAVAQDHRGYSSLTVTFSNIPDEDVLALERLVTGVTSALVSELDYVSMWVSSDLKKTGKECGKEDNELRFQFGPIMNRQDARQIAERYLSAALGGASSDDEEKKGRHSHSVELSIPNTEPKKMPATAERSSLRAGRRGRALQCSDPDQSPPQQEAGQIHMTQSSTV